MKTFPNAKNTLKKFLPEKSYSLIRLFWINIIVSSSRYFEIFYLKLFFRKETVKTLNSEGLKIKIKINPKNGFVDNYIFMYGVYEPHIISFMLNNLKENDTFLDIGTNIGQHSLFAAKKLIKGKVHSFEPIKSIFDQYQRSIKENNFTNIIANNFGLAQENKEVGININEINAGGSSMLDLNSNSQQEAATVTEKVIIKNGDEVLSGENKIDFMKIDVEGYEYEVMKGLEKMIDKYKPKIIFEFSPHLYRDSNICEVTAPLVFLKNKNYEFINLENNERVYNVNEFTADLLDAKNIYKEQANIYCYVK